MNNPDNITLPELDALVEHFPTEDGIPYPAAKEWKRVDVGDTEVYVGDPKMGVHYVVGLVEKIPQTEEEMDTNGESTETVVIRYLQGEGFIGEEFVYVGLQRFDLKNLPKDSI